MANTFSQIYIQIIHSTKARQPLIIPEFKEELFKYITGIIKNRKQKLISINGTSNHIHYLVGLKPDIAISDLVRDVKHFSTDFVNEKKFIRYKFAWQVGFGAFSYSHSQLDKVIKYIQNQEEHHRKITFQEEYLKFLDSFGIKYDLKYVFD